MTPSRPSIRAAALATCAVGLALAAVALPRPAAGQTRTGETYRIDTTVTVGRGASVDLDLPSGDILVTAWDRDQVQVRARSEGPPLRFEHVGGTVRVGVASGRSRGGDQRMEVVVPVGTRVAASSASGDVAVRGVRGALEASAVSGDLEIADVVGRASIHTVSGDLRAVRLDGDVRARTVSGDLTLDGVDGEIDAESVSGDVDIRRAGSARVRIQTVSGEIGYDGTVDRGGRYEFASHSGEIALRLPADAAATLELQSFSGHIDSEFAMTMGPTRDRDDGRRARRRMEFTINGGGARLTAETFSGSVSIKRASSTRPSTARD